MSFKQLKIKVVLGEDIRRWRYPEDVNNRYSDLLKFIDEAFNLGGGDFALKYEDDENDQITMSNQRDFVDAFDAALEEKRRSLKIFVIPAGKSNGKKSGEKEEKSDEAQGAEEEEEEINIGSLRTLALDFLSNEEIVALLPLAFTTIVKELKNCNLKEVKMADVILKVLKTDAFDPITAHKLFPYVIKFLPCICARAERYIPFIINDSTNEAAILSFLPQMITLVRMGLLRFENIDFDIELDGRKVNVGSFIPDWFAFGCDKNKEEDNNVHKGITCDGCNKYPIVGARYKCSICEDFDLCQDCEAANKHNPSHPMLKFYLNQQFHHSLFRGLNEVMKRNDMASPPPPFYFGGRHMHHHSHSRGGPNFHHHHNRDFGHRRHGRHHRHNRCGGGYNGRKWNVNVASKNDIKNNKEDNEDKARADAMVRLAESNSKNSVPAKKEQEKSLIALEKNVINEENDEIKKDEEEEEEEVVIGDEKAPIFCFCGSALIELNDRRVICDICNKRCNKGEKVYHCPKDNNEFHPRGYDVCLTCGDIQRLSLMEMNKPKEVNEEVEKEEEKEKEVVSEIKKEKDIDDVEVEIIPGDNIPSNEIDIYGDEDEDEDDNEDVPAPIASDIAVVDMDEESEAEEAVIEEVNKAEDNKEDDFAYGEQLKMLLDMGFEKNDTIYALLVQKNGNVQEVITQLLQ